MIHAAELSHRQAKTTGAKYARGVSLAALMKSFKNDMS
jgi:hypothetical protein